ncbi:MAG: CFI-box-CTERM domain-containing protein [bacterium]
MIHVKMGESSKQETIAHGVIRMTVVLIFPAILSFTFFTGPIRAGAAETSAVNQAFSDVLDNLMSNYWSPQDNGDWLHDEIGGWDTCAGYDASQYSTDLLYPLALETGDSVFEERANRTVEYVIGIANLEALLEKVTNGEDLTEEGASLPALLYGQRYYTGASPYEFDGEIRVVALLAGGLLHQGYPFSDILNAYSGPAAVAYYILISAYTFRDQGAPGQSFLMARQAYSLLDLAEPYWVQETEDSGYYEDPASWDSLWDWGLVLQGVALAYQASGQPSYLKRARDMLNYMEADWDGAAPYGYCDSPSCTSKTLSVNHMLARGLLILYDATGEPAWLERAAKVIEFMTDPAILIEDDRFPGFRIIGHDWTSYYGANHCSCSGCNFAVLAAICNHNVLERDGPQGIDPLPGCVIATTAYGSGLDGRIRMLREFRDRHLSRWEPGRELIASYYRYSPALADALARHEWLRTIVQALLLPFIGFASLLV